jgi:transcriptional regulator with XRE-family HTH domain
MRKFADLKARMSTEDRERVRRRKQELIDEMPLQELRLARSLTQKQLSEVLHIDQAAISRLERRTDMYVSTLRNIIAAMGGDLEVYAAFPEGRVRITQFEELGGPADR